LGETYRLNGKYERALVVYQRAQKIAPKHIPVLVGLGRVYADMGDWERAEANYSEALEINNESAGGNAGMGDVHFNRRRLKEANIAYLRARELDPREPTIYVGWATCWQSSTATTKPNLPTKKRLT
jgi:cytochrome c-type biogenesis protein CcmH/NrfG